jgi:hypothetical protein
MDFAKAVRNINRSLIKKQPLSFSSVWINYCCKISHQFITKNIKTEFGETDWDTVVSKLDRSNQKLWLKGKKRKTPNPYEGKVELSSILNKYSGKLYTFLSAESKEDKIVCDWISIRLVRLAQKGNVSAKHKLIKLLSCLIGQWIESGRLSVWKGYGELADRHIDVCIRRFRYAGSFLGYLYRTLEYSGRGLVPLEKFSLDDFSLITGKRIIDNFVK